MKSSVPSLVSENENEMKMIKMPVCILYMFNVNANNATKTWPYQTQKKDTADR